MGECLNQQPPSCALFEYVHTLDSTISTCCHYGQSTAFHTGTVRTMEARALPEFKSGVAGFNSCIIK
jgi:hypothetical protein